MRPRVCFVVQRYGIEVNGGAELQCRQLAERLMAYADVEILTTKAIKYTTWEDEYQNDLDIINGVPVRRFSVKKIRDVEKFSGMAARFDDPIMLTIEEEKDWIEEQGPKVPQLLAYIKKHKADYDVFFFFTYLYYQSVFGLPEVKEKAIFIPDAHDEPFLRMRIIQNVFRSPKAILFNTSEECRLVHRKFYNHAIRYEIGGVGVDVPEKVDAEAFKKKYSLENYIVYIGRIDLGKNCHELFRDFIAFKEKYPSDLKLVLMGKEIIDIPQRDDLVSLGFVSDEDKFNGIAGAKLLVLPSRFESLSMVVLEAFSLDRPVLVNGNCEVLKGHCIKSNAGFYYYNSEEFQEMLFYLVEHEQSANLMGCNGHKYVDENYQWDVIMKKMMSLIHYVMGK